MISYEVISTHVNDFGGNFNALKINDVMSAFSEDAKYRTIQGDDVIGLSSIEKEFLPQFSGRYGQMTFQYDDLLVDSRQGKATLLWTCIHDFSIQGKGLKNNLIRWVYRLVNGRRCYWYGCDIFHFDENGKITLKASYTTSKIPRMFKLKRQKK